MDTQAVQAQVVQEILERYTDRKWAREYMGLSRAKLAEILNVCEATIRRWEDGSRRPTGTPALEYAEFLNLAYGLRAEEIEEEEEDDG
jgi:DNA-binding transcriptional regulator YiaG